MFFYQKQIEDSSELDLYENNKGNFKLEFILVWLGVILFCVIFWTVVLSLLFKAVLS